MPCDGPSAPDYYINYIHLRTPRTCMITCLPACLPVCMYVCMCMCMQNLLEDSGADLANTLLAQLATYRREVLKTLVKHERDGGNSEDEAAAPAAAEEDNEQAARNRKRFNHHMR